MKYSLFLPKVAFGIKYQSISLYKKRGSPALGEMLGVLGMVAVVHGIQW